MKLRQSVEKIDCICCQPFIQLLILGKNHSFQNMVTKRYAMWATAASAINTYIDLWQRFFQKFYLPPETRALCNSWESDCIHYVICGRLVWITARECMWCSVDDLWDRSTGQKVQQQRRDRCVCKQTRMSSSYVVLPSIWTEVELRLGQLYWSCVCGCVALQRISLLPQFWIAVNAHF